MRKSGERPPVIPVPDLVRSLRAMAEVLQRIQRDSNDADQADLNAAATLNEIADLLEANPREASRGDRRFVFRKIDEIYVTLDAESQNQYLRLLAPTPPKAPF